MGRIARHFYLSCMAFLALSLCSAGQAGALDDQQKKEIGAFIKQYLIENPEVLLDVQSALEQKQAEEQASKNSKVIESNKDSIFQSSDDAVFGNPKGSVTIVEFFDYNCHYCKQALPDMEAILQKNNDIRFVLKEFPILGPESIAAHKVADAFRLIAPEKYYDFHRALLGGEERATEESALAVAAKLGITEAEIRAKMKASPFKARATKVYSLAEKMGINGTPAYIIGNETMSGAVGIDLLSSKVSNVRTCGKTVC
jgi:protein-disulfide isomerase